MHRQGLIGTICVPVQPHRPGSQRVFTALCRLIGFPVQTRPVCCSPSLVSYPSRSFRPSQEAIPICSAYSCTTPGHKEPETCHYNPYLLPPPHIGHMAIWALCFLSFRDSAGLYPALVSTNESIAEQMLTVSLADAVVPPAPCREGNYILLKGVPET